MFALRWHQAESVVRFVAAELFFLNQVQYVLVPHLDKVSDFNIKGKKIYTNITIESIIMTTKWP